VENDPINPEVVEPAVGAAPPDEVGYPGIGGVLIFVAIGLIWSLLGNLVNLFGTLVPFRDESLWGKLTTPSSPLYHAYWKPLFIYEAVAAALLLVSNAIVVVLFFKRKRLFPTFIVIMLPLIFLTTMVSHFVMGWIPGAVVTKAYSKDTHLLIARFVTLHVWIPYFLVSRRVKGTFVH
jgi:hypothetical protein